MKVKDIMTKRAARIGPEASAREAASKMRGEKIGSLLVVDEEGKLLGITTDRIIALDVAGKGLDPRKTKVKDFMEENIISVSPEMDLAKAAKLLEELEIRYLPVVRGDKVVGILSVSDIARFVQGFIDSIFVELTERVKKREKKRK